MGSIRIVLGLALSLAGTLAAASHAGDARATNDIKVIAKGAFSGIQQPEQIVITNATQWAELWKQHTVKREPKPELPEVDFSKQTLLFVSLGEKRTGGYSVEIADLLKENGKVVVLAKSHAPKPGGFQIQAITAPFIIVAVPKLDGKVEFKLE
jgi:protease stability complex PrcB-like protein